MQPPIYHCALVSLRKSGRMRYLSHLDFARALDRAVRRAGLPVKYSEGFNPSAHISFASALPVGVAGERELCQIELERPLPPEEILRALSAQLPEGLGVVDVRVVSGPRRKHLSGLTRAEYEVELAPAPEVTVEAIEEAVRRVLDAGTLTITRETRTRTREVDIRPGIYKLEVMPPASRRPELRLRMTLALAQDSLVKPGEVIAILQRFLTDLVGEEIVLTPVRMTRLGMY